MARILVIGGGIGGLTSAIALRQRGHGVDVIERDPDWSVYGVGIIQQANVIRAVAQLGDEQAHRDRDGHRQARHRPADVTVLGATHSHSAGCRCVCRLRRRQH